ncbi:hypothetical protein BGY98DRAFT_946884 [Russula aff. rugulosa BPL654]|nr:hypothetical protein BGY98DRAFT_946884 [Russula aff. rugulosa BPL654]
MHHACIIARRAAFRAKPLARSMSSKPNPQAQPHDFVLPPEKLRALVSLYHQSKSFITPENLDEEIDRAFAEPPSVRVFENRRLVDWPSLRLEVKERDRLSKFGLPETLDSVLSMYEVGYHEERERRVEQVFDAMYGTLETDKPGLELLQDTWVDVEQRLKGEEDSEEGPVS